jgi:hypothetical protein
MDGLRPEDDGYVPCHVYQTRGIYEYGYKGCAGDIKDLSKQAAAYGFIMS